MMDLTLTNTPSIKNTNLIKILLWIVFLFVCTLSVKAAYDLTKDSEIFPVWFVPGFALVILVLIALSLYFVLQLQKTDSNLEQVTRRQATYLWLFMLLSFICTTSVHGFYPFHRYVLLVLPAVDSVMKTNYAIGLIGFALSAVLAGMYLLGKQKHPAMLGLLLISFGMLIPNDNCANPFNYWWIETVGASPLMYVPNMYAALFVTCGLYGIQPKIANFVTMGICAASLLLGVGHQLGIIW